MAKEIAAAFVSGFPKTPAFALAKKILSYPICYQLAFLTALMAGMLWLTKAEFEVLLCSLDEILAMDSVLSCVS